MHLNKCTYALSGLIGWVYALWVLTFSTTLITVQFREMDSLTDFWVSLKTGSVSAIDWIHQHVVQHHVNCVDVEHDPDMLCSSVLRLN